MKKIKLNTVKIKNTYYLKVPDVVANAYHLKNNDDLEFTCTVKSKNQIELWDLHLKILIILNLIYLMKCIQLTMYMELYS